MPTSTITIDVHLDENKVPEKISWRATDSSVATAQLAKAMMIAFWDAADKSALRIDLWTKDMMIDERSEEHTSELQSHLNLVCRLLLEKKKKPCPKMKTTGTSLR